MTAVGPKTGGFWLWRKQATAAVLTALLPAPRLHEIELERPLRVAYLRFDRRVGEVLLQTPIFHAHRAARPRDTILAVTHPKMVRILAGQPTLDEVVPFSWRGFPVLREAHEALERLRALNVDVAVDCSDPTIFSVGHALATRMTGAPVRIGFDRGPAAGHYTHPVPVAATVHEATARASLLGPLRVDAGPTMHWEPHPRAPVTVDSVSVLDVMGREPGRHAVVCPGGRLGWRRAQPEHFAALCTALASVGRTAWLAPGPGEEALCQQVHALAPAARLLPVTDLDQLGALARAAGIVVCNNSGTMHLSVAAGARTFALFVRMDPQRWGHHDPRHRMHRFELEDTGASAAMCAALLQWLQQGAA